MKPLASPDELSAAMEAVAFEYGIHSQWMIGARRKNQLISEARTMFWLILRAGPGPATYQMEQAIGVKAGAVSFSMKKVVVWLKVYPALRKRYDRIVDKYWQLKSQPSDSERLEWLMKMCGIRVPQMMGTTVTRAEIDAEMKSKIKLTSQF